MRSRCSAAGQVPKRGELEVYHGGNPRGDLGVKPTWVETLGLGKERCYCLPGLKGARQEWGSEGCQSLSCLSVALPALPQAAILQQTAEYIFSLEQEKTRLLQQNTQLKRFIQVVPGWGGGGDDVIVPRDQDETLCPNKPGNGNVWHLPGWAGEPGSVQRPSAGSGRTAGAPSSVWGVGVRLRGSSGSGVAQLKCPGCRSVRSGFAQGWEGRGPGGWAHAGRGSLRHRPHVLLMSLGSPVPAGSCVGGGQLGGMTQM